jgi:transposase-like protein
LFRDNVGMIENTPVVSAPRQKHTREDTSARWRKLVEQQRASGLSVSAFCREHGLTAASMFAWRRRFAGGAAMFKSVKIVQEAVPHSSADAGDSSIELPAARFVELRLPGRRRLIVRRGFDRRLLLDLLDALDGRVIAPRAGS